MPKISDLVSGLTGDWKIVGTGMPIEETTAIANPDAADVATGGAARITQGTGRYYVVVQDAEGHQRALYLKASPIKGGIEIPVTGQPPAAGTTPFTGDLRTLDWTQAGAIQDVPQHTAQASQDLINQKSQADAALAQAQAGLAQATTLKTSVDAQIAADPTNQALQQQKLQADNALAAAQTAAQQANATKVQADAAIAAQKAPGEIALTGAQAAAQQASAEAQKATAEATAAKTPSEISLTQAQTAAQLGAAAKAAEPTPLVADLVAPFIMTVNPATGQVESQPNQNQLKVSDATSQLAQQLGLKVAAGSMSEKQAQDVITGAINTMNAQSQQAQAQAQQGQVAGTAAGDILRNTQQAATTGAGLLQQRAQAATGTLQSILGNTLGNKNVTSYAPDTAANLVQGLQGWTASLMGGQGTLDSAARMVQMADPKSSLADPSTQTAIGTLSQMLDKYQQLTGAPHPAVAATQAAGASAQNGGMVAPGADYLASVAAQPGLQAAPAPATGYTPPGGSNYSYPSVPWAGATPQTLQSQTGAGVGAGFTAPQIGAGVGAGFTAPRSPITITVG